MAIQLSSAPKTESNKSLWVTIFLYFSLVFFLASVSSYFVFDYYAKKYSKNIEEIKMNIEQKGTAEEKKREEYILEKQETIKDFSKLLDEHKFVSSFFTNFESWCHPRVWFSRVNLNVADLTVGLSGQTDNFETLGQQILVFRNNKFIKGIDLSNIQMNDEGKIDFNLSVVFDGQVLSYDFEKLNK